MEIYSYETSKVEEFLLNRSKRILAKGRSMTYMSTMEDEELDQISRVLRYPLGGGILTKLTWQNSLLRLDLVGPGAGN